MDTDVLQVQNSLGIVGRNPRLQQAISTAIKTAPFDVNVLILGENGVGKEVFHRIIHNYSKRKHNKCIPVSCAALPEGTINSELFGHIKGAFTGATTDRKGFFEECDGGTIFLDEVGELPLDTQARLLRIIETGEYQRMGSNEVRKVNVRIVAATNRDLPKAIARGTFREDLYYRLSTIIINLPPLRERPEDIYLLFRKFASDIAGLYNVPTITLDDDAKQMLLAYQWPGNIRELRHVVQGLSIMTEDRVITANMLKQFLQPFESRMSFGNQHNGDEFQPGEKAALYQLIMNMSQQLEEVRQQLGLSSPSTNAAPTAYPRVLGSGSPIITTPNPEYSSKKTIVDFEEQEAVEVDVFKSPTPARTYPTQRPKTKTLEEMEKEAIIEAVKRHGGNKRKAAEELGIAERTIHRRIKEFGLDGNTL